MHVAKMIIQSRGLSNGLEQGRVRVHCAQRKPWSEPPNKMNVCAEELPSRGW